MQDATPQRKIIHVDMDAFYASVEQRDDKTLQGKPVIVAWRGQRSVVCAASYEARKFGVRSAMPAITAQRLCPNGVFVPPNFARYKAVSAKIRDIFERYSTQIEPLSLDEAYLDVTNPLNDLGSATAVAAAIRSDIQNELDLTASAGIAGNKFLAKIASDWNKPNGQFVIRPRDAISFLTRLPVGKIPGVGKVLEGKLTTVGIRTCGDIRAFGQELLIVQFGDTGRRLYDLAHGIDHRPVNPDQAHVQISAEDTFETDLPMDATEPYIRRLAERVWRSYENKCVNATPPRHARTVVLKLKTADFQTITRSLTPFEMPGDALSLAELALDLRDRVDSHGALYRLVGVGLSGIEDHRIEQAVLKY